MASPGIRGVQVSDVGGFQGTSAASSRSVVEVLDRKEIKSALEIELKSKEIELKSKDVSRGTVPDKATLYQAVNTVLKEIAGRSELTSSGELRKTIETVKAFIEEHSAIGDSLQGACKPILDGIDPKSALKREITLAFNETKPSVSGELALSISISDEVGQPHGGKPIEKAIHDLKTVSIERTIIKLVATDKDVREQCKLLRQIGQTLDKATAMIQYFETKVQYDSLSDSDPKKQTLGAALKSLKEQAGGLTDPSTFKEILKDLDAGISALKLKKETTKEMTLLKQLCERLEDGSKVKGSAKPVAAYRLSAAQKQTLDTKIQTAKAAAEKLIQKLNAGKTILPKAFKESLETIESHIKNDNIAAALGEVKGAFERMEDIAAGPYYKDITSKQKKELMPLLEGIRKGISEGRMAQKDGVSESDKATPLDKAKKARSTAVTEEGIRKADHEVQKATSAGNEVVLEQKITRLAGKIAHVTVKDGVRTHTLNAHISESDRQEFEDLLKETMDNLSKMKGGEKIQNRAPFLRLQSLAEQFPKGTFKEQLGVLATKLKESVGPATQSSALPEKEKLQKEQKALNVIAGLVKQRGNNAATRKDRALLAALREQQKDLKLEKKAIQKGIPDPRAEAYIDRKLTLLDRVFKPLDTVKEQSESMAPGRHSNSESIAINRAIKQAADMAREIGLDAGIADPGAGADSVDDESSNDGRSVSSAGSDASSEIGEAKADFGVKREGVSLELKTGIDTLKALKKAVEKKLRINEDPELKTQLQEINKAIRKAIWIEKSMSAYTDERAELRIQDLQKEIESIAENPKVQAAGESSVGDPDVQDRLDDLSGKVSALRDQLIHWNKDTKKEQLRTELERYSQEILEYSTSEDPNDDQKTKFKALLEDVAKVRRDVWGRTLVRPAVETGNSRIEVGSTGASVISKSKEHPKILMLQARHLALHANVIDNLEPTSEAQEADKEYAELRAIGEVYDTVLTALKSPGNGETIDGKTLSITVMDPSVLERNPRMSGRTGMQERYECILSQLFDQSVKIDANGRIMLQNLAGLKAIAEKGTEHLTGVGYNTNQRHTKDGAPFTSGLDRIRNLYFQGLETPTRSTSIESLFIGEATDNKSVYRRVLLRLEPGDPTEERLAPPPPAKPTPKQQSTPPPPPPPPPPSPPNPGTTQPNPGTTQPNPGLGGHLEDDGIIAGPDQGKVVVVPLAGQNPKPGQTPKEPILMLEDRKKPPGGDKEDGEIKGAELPIPAPKLKSYQPMTPILGEDHSIQTTPVTISGWTEGPSLEFKPEAMPEYGAVDLPPIRLNVLQIGVVRPEEGVQTSDTAGRIPNLTPPQLRLSEVKPQEIGGLSRPLSVETEPLERVPEHKELSAALLYRTQQTGVDPLRDTYQAAALIAVKGFQAKARDAGVTDRDRVIQRRNITRAKELGADIARLQTDVEAKQKGLEKAVNREQQGIDKDKAALTQTIRTAGVIRRQQEAEFAKFSAEAMAEFNTAARAILDETQTVTASASHTTSVQAAQDELATFAEGLATAQDPVLEGLKGQQTSKLGEIATLKKELQVLESEISADRLALDQVEIRGRGAVASESKELSAIQDQLERKQSELQRYSMALEAKRSEINGVVDEYTRIHNKFKASIPGSDESQALEKALDDLTEKRRVLDKEYGALKGGIDPEDLKAKIRSLDERQQAIGTQINHARTDQSAQESEIRKKTERYNKIRANIQKKGQELGGIQDQIQSRTAAVVDERNAAIADQKEALEQGLGRRLETVKTAEIQRRSGQTERVALLKQDLETRLAAQKETVEQKIADAEARIKPQEDALKAKISSLNTKIERANRELAAKKAEIEKLRDAYEETCDVLEEQHDRQIEGVRNYGPPPAYIGEAFDLINRLARDGATEDAKSGDVTHLASGGDRVQQQIIIEKLYSGDPLRRPPIPPIPVTIPPLDRHTLMILQKGGKIGKGASEDAIQTMKTLKQFGINPQILEELGADAISEMIGTTSGLKLAMMATSLYVSRSELTPAQHRYLMGTGASAADYLLESLVDISKNATREAIKRPGT